MAIRGREWPVAVQIQGRGWLVVIRGREWLVAVQSWRQLHVTQG